MQQSGRGVTARAPGPAVEDEEDFSYDGAVSRVQEALGKGGKHGKLLQALRALTAHAIDAPTLHALCHCACTSAADSTPC